MNNKPPISSLRVQIKKLNLIHISLEEYKIKHQNRDKFNCLIEGCALMSSEWQLNEILSNYTNGAYFFYFCDENGVTKLSKIAIRF